MIQWETDLPTAQARAERERKFLLIDFAKDPCPDCSALDTLTFTDTRVQALIAAHVVPLHLLLGVGGPSTNRQGFYHPLFLCQCSRLAWLMR